MKTGAAYDGAPSPEELAASPGYPSTERIARGKVALIECVQQIPCNPCETACPHGAIAIGRNICDLPVLDGEKCIGCGLCIAACPGQAIFVVDMQCSDGEATVSFPFEYLPLPAVGDEVEAVDRFGQRVGVGRVQRVQAPKRNDRTPVVTLAVPKAIVLQVRSMARHRGDR